MTANFEGIKDGPCKDELIVVTCSVVGTTLRWTIIDSSFVISGSNTVTLSANPNDEGRRSVIPTSATNLEFYQNETVQNLTHPSSSRIKSELRFRFDAENEYVVVSCTNTMSLEMSDIIIIGM